MTLPTERFSPTSVGNEIKGGGSGLGGLAVLDHQGDVGLWHYRDMRWCAQCGGAQVFLEVYEFESGRVGVCLGCGEERVVAFTRITSEAA
jgi:hypothetical protein